MLVSKDPGDNEEAVFEMDRKALYPITLDPRASCPPLLRRMVAANLLGRKSGRGFYTYDRNAMFGG